MANNEAPTVSVPQPEEATAEAGDVSSAPRPASKTSIEKVKHARKIWAPTKTKRGLSETQVQKMQRAATRFFTPPKLSTTKE